MVELRSDPVPSVYEMPLAAAPPVAVKVVGVGQSTQSAIDRADEAGQSCALIIDDQTVRIRQPTDGGGNPADMALLISLAMVERVELRKQC